MTSKVTENTRDSLEKVMSGAKLEERENRSTSFSPAIEDQERVPKIHLKTVILIIVSQPSISVLFLIMLADGMSLGCLPRLRCRSIQYCSSRCIWA